MKTNKIISILMCFALLFGTLTVSVISVNAKTSGDYEYQILDDGTVEITGYSEGEVVVIKIPSKIDGYSVTSIGDYVFYGCELYGVTIPDGVKNIGYSAFEKCDLLTDISIPNSVTSIGSSAFDNTGYYNNESNWEDNALYLGNNLISASYYHLDDDTDEVKSFEVSGDYKVKEGTKVIASGAFYRCNSLISITIPNSVTIIDDYTFENCESLTNVTIPDSVTSIGDSAFFGCTSLTSITIPNSIKSIGSSAFSYCSEDFIIYGYTNSEAERYANDNGIIFIALDGGTTPELPTPTTIRPTTQTVPTQPTTPTVTQPTQANNTTQPTDKATIPNTKTTTAVKLSVKAPNLTSGKKLFKVKYTNVKNAVGFQVRYKTGKGKWKVKTFNTAKSATKVIKGLKKGKYKVQIRTFTKGKKVYSNWTKAKTVKVK